LPCDSATWSQLTRPNPLQHYACLRQALTHHAGSARGTATLEDRRQLKRKLTEQGGQETSPGGGPLGADQQHQQDGRCEHSRLARRQNPPAAILIGGGAFGGTVTLALMIMNVLSD
jgi:hypothetical protein